ncbi:MAG: ubiquinol-cytochrome C chaperone [Hyphomicrobiaceae bacterium]|nr:ubiquinol-cytochrome C chaperone [Hyphomicrobiaceae bacterium]MCC0024489.1 ubiquinol-cytochrome C chaperone [Hyphomicrobiaceae bacterium]
MLSIFRKRRFGPQHYAAYNAIVAQSRQPRFYEDWGVPDNVTGRFDMISLHMALVFRQLRNRSDRASKFSQDLFDLFFLDMDRSLREAGTGDISIPKRIQKMGALFYGLLEKLNVALDSNDNDEVTAILRRNLVDKGTGDAELRQFSDYVAAANARLAGINVESLLKGEVEFPEVAA